MAARRRVGNCAGIVGIGSPFKIYWTTCMTLIRFDIGRMYVAEISERVVVIGNRANRSGAVAVAATILELGKTSIIPIDELNLPSDIGSYGHQSPVPGGAIPKKIYAVPEPIFYAAKTTLV